MKKGRRVSYRLGAFLEIRRHVCNTLEVRSKGSIVERVIPVPGGTALG